MDIHPATLAQVIADDKLLRRLDRGPKQPFPLTAADLKHVVLLVEGSPQYLAKRMQVLESRLAGKQHLALTARPAAQARRLVQATGGHATAQLWVLPYDTLQRRLRLGPRAVATQLFALLPFFSSSAEPLYRGRVLHLKGRFAGEQSATAYYLKARPSNEDLEVGYKEQMADIAKRPRDEQFGRVAEVQFRTKIVLDCKQDASYWLGLVAFEQGNYASAIDYFTKRTLGADPNSPWIVGASYNTARAYRPPASSTRPGSGILACGRFPPAPTATCSGPPGWGRRGARDWGLGTGGEDNTAERVRNYVVSRVLGRYLRPEAKDPRPPPPIQVARRLIPKALVTQPSLR